MTTYRCEKKIKRCCGFIVQHLRYLFPGKMAFKNKMGIEIPILLAFYAFMLSAPVDTNFVIYRTCYVILGYNVSECAKLGSSNKDNSTDDLEKIVEPKANVILMTVSLTSQILPALTCLFIGSWSDKHGRRLILLVSMFGFAFNYVIKTVISIFPYLSPWVLIVQSVPAAMSGGLITFIMISLCFITDTSTVENRGIRIATFESMLALGMLLGTASSSYLYNATNYTVVYFVCAVCAFLAYLYAYFFVEETIVPQNCENKGALDLFSLTRVKEVITTTVKYRENYKRPILLMLMVTLILYILSINNNSVSFQFFRLKFQWSMKKYTLFTSLSSVLFMFGTFMGVYIFNKILKISETTLLIMSFLMMSIGYTMYALANTEKYIYAATGLQALVGVVSPMVRSLISKIVCSEEIGKVFSLMLSLEALMGILGNSLVTLVYNSTIPDFPGAFYLVGTSIYLLNLALIIIVTILTKITYESPYNELMVDT